MDPLDPIPERLKPACYGLQELFFSPELDGRDEAGRQGREDFCKSICFGCSYRIRCLWISFKGESQWGVWGAMGEGERRRFFTFMGEVLPESELEFRKAVSDFYEHEANKPKKRRRRSAT